MTRVRDGDRHVFRFFVDARGDAGAVLPLSSVDRRHGEVLRLAPGDVVELVDGDAVVWDAAWRAGGEVELVAQQSATATLAPIELYAGVLSGNRFDALVDGAVQAGAASITPVAASTREAQRLAARVERLQRVADAAARQAKRTFVPQVHAPIGGDEIPGGGGVVVDPSAPAPLDQVIASSGPIRLLVGAADGIQPQVLERLVQSGWQHGRLGPTILRSELAAPVAVAIAVMAADASRRSNR